MARIIKSLWEPRIPLLRYVLCVISPEHFNLLRSQLASKEHFKNKLYQHCCGEMADDVPFIISNFLAPKLYKHPVFQMLSAVIMPMRVAGVAASLLLLFGNIAQFSDSSESMISQSGKFWNLNRVVGLLTLLGCLSPGRAWMRALGHIFGVFCRACRLIGFPSKLVSKVLSPDSFQIIVAGGGAGKFSAFCPGFGAGRDGPMARLTEPISRQVDAKLSKQQMKTRRGVLRFDTRETDQRTILDPRFEGKVPTLTLAPRDGTLKAPIAFMDISKGKGELMLNRLESLFKKSYPDIPILRFCKPTFSRPCPEELMDEIVNSGANHVVAALAD